MKERKKILVCSHWLEIGGAEKALIGLLDALSESDYEIDLFLCRHSGSLMKDIPSKINLLPENNNAACIALPYKDVLKRKAYMVLLGRMISKVHGKLYLKKHPSKDSNVFIEYSHLHTYRYVKHIRNDIKYDLMLSFLTPHYISSYRTNAKKKIAWIHTDYTAVDMDCNTAEKVWKTFDYIASISDECSKGFAKMLPDLSDKIVLIENILPVRMIIQQSRMIVDDWCPKDNDTICLLSIGRYTTAKNFDNVPDICAKIRSAGLNVKWYIIGFGGDEALICQKIAEAGMEDFVILLGKKDNPYPYIAACDLYVQPSRYEGKCVTVREAQILGKPVVITNYATSASQLEDGVDGVVVPMDNEGCAAGIAELLKDPQRMKRLSETCQQRDYSNAQEVEKIYRLME